MKLQQHRLQPCEERDEFAYILVGPVSVKDANGGS
jgi:hypothetical protein